MPTASPPTAYQHKDKDHSTTHSAVEEGVIIIRDKDKQQQDINTLSRDTQNANNELDPIFDKQKELDRIEKIELIADIASQAKDLAQKYSRMQAEEKYKALSPEEKDEIDNKIRKELEGRDVDFSKYNEEGKQAAIRDEYIRQVSQSEGFGNMGDGFSKGIDAATSIVIGIIKGDITGGLAGASAPYLATLIKEQTGHYDAASKTWITDNKAANLVAHAILGAVVAELQGNSGLSGGIGAITGEVAAEFMAKHIYGKDVKDLTEAEKRNISSLSQLASGLAVASVGGNTGDIAAAIASSKNAVENNYLSSSEHQKKTTLEHKEKNGELTEAENLRLIELKVKDETTTNELIAACVNVASDTCKAERKKAYDDMSTYKDLNYQYPKENLAGYREISNLLKATSPEGDLMRKYQNAYKNAYINIGYSEKEADLMAAHTMSVQLLSHTVAGAISLSTLNKAFSGSYNKAMSSPSALPKQKTINPATNRVVTEHIVVSSGKAPKTSTPNSIYEVSRADGTRSITYYNDKGLMFSREDYGQQRTHGQLGYNANGKVPPHEHKQTYKSYNGQEFKDKSYYRVIDENGKPVGPWILDK